MSRLFLKWLLMLAVPVCLTVQFACASQSTDKSKLIPALVFKQKHFYWGATESIISLNGIRINNRGRMFYSLVASSPSWDVTVFRDDDKTYLKQSLSDFESSGLVNNFVVNKQARIFGRNIPESLAKLNGFTIKQIIVGPHLYQYLPLGNIVPKQAERILYAAYKLPTNNGIPIKLIKHRTGLDWMTGINDPGSQKVLIDTYKIDKITVSPDIFKAPEHYKLSASMQEVLMSKVSRDASGDLEVLIGDQK